MNSPACISGSPSPASSSHCHYLTPPPPTPHPQLSLLSLSFSLQTVVFMMSLLMHIILYNISFTLTFFFPNRHLCIDVAYRSKKWGHCRTPVLFLKACEDQLPCLQNKSESIEVYRKATLLLVTFTDGFMVSSFKPHIIWHGVHSVHSALMQKKTYDSTAFAFGWAYLVIDELLTIWVAYGMQSDQCCACEIWFSKNKAAAQNASAKASASFI